MNLDAAPIETAAVLPADQSETSLPMPFNSDAEEILSLVGDGVVSIDWRGRIILFNRAAEDLFGFSSEELVGCPIDVLIPARFHDRHRQDIESFVVPAVPVRRSMGAGRTVLGVHKDGRELVIEATLSRHMLAGQQTFTAVIRDVTDRESADQRRLLVAGEVAHRLRNTMAVVNSIVALTARGKTSVPDFVEALLGRFTAISRTNDALIGGTWDTTSVSELLLSELAPYHGESGRIALSGPEVRLDGKLALALALIFHELATNAAKHGSLSTPEGTIQVEWQLQPGQPPVLSLKWRELGGPEVSPPTRRSFGSRLISRSLHGYDGTAELTFPTQGACCSIVLPLPMA
jgi:PAS domain S-box-containing protein